MVIIAVVAIYYVIVLLLLLRNGLLSTSLLKRPAPASPRPPKPVAVPVRAIETTSVGSTSNENEVEVQMTSLIEEVNNFLRDLAGQSYVKEEIIMGLQVIFRDYKDFANTKYQSDINEFIVAEVDNYCSVDLSSDEVSSVWMG